MATKPTTERGARPDPRAGHPRPVSVGEAWPATGSQGLSEADAAERLSQYGPNEIEAEREEPWWRILLQQIRDPLIYILLAAAAVTAVLRDYIDTAVILAVVVINTVIGLIQDMRARKEIRALARLSAPRAEVLRDGHAREIESRGLVPGDVVLLTSGVRVPADVRLFRAQGLKNDESALTGESQPVAKTTDPIRGEDVVPGDQTNVAFAGTVVTRVRGRGIVVRTGAATELGRITTAVRELGTVTTPLQEKVVRLGHWIAYAILGLSIIVIAVGAVRGLSAHDIFLTVVAMAGATIPEGLPVVLTVTLAVGVRRMAKRKAIIRSLPAVETLGSTTVIGSDKTGTLTRNEMTVRAVWAAGERYGFTGVGYDTGGRIEQPGGGVRAHEDTPLFRTLLAGALANEADPGSVAEGKPRGDPTELALLVSAAKAGIGLHDLRETYPQLDIVPFEPEHRFMATLNEEPGGRRVLSLKGAPEAILSRCDRALTDQGPGPLNPKEVRAAARSLAAEGLRVLAVAYRPEAQDRIEERMLEDGLIFCGLQGM
jgi:magnesium-transporting ATPase (P-type)